MRTDLGLGDGAFVRDADAVLKELAADSRIDFLPVGLLPEPQRVEAGREDVGLPAAGSEEPGSMTLTEAETLLASVPDCDWLVLTSPLLVGAVLRELEGGSLSVDGVLVLDDENWNEVASTVSTPVYRVHYDVRPVAFAAGVAAAASSNNSMFIALASDADPQAELFLSAVAAGAKYWTNGTVIYTALVPTGADGLVDPNSFQLVHQRVLKEAGAYFNCNHYIVSLGRATPTIMHALTQNPINGYVAGAYADYRIIRPARVLGCAVKQPGAALRYIFDDFDPVQGLESIAPHGVVEVGLAQDAVGFTGFELYKRYNTDGDDIEEAVTGVLEEIRAGELDLVSVIEQFSKPIG